MHAGRDQVLARCMQMQPLVPRLVCLGKACTISSQIAEQTNPGTELPALGHL